MTFQEKLQKKAEEFGEHSQAFLEGAKFAIENGGIQPLIIVKNVGGKISIGTWMPTPKIKDEKRKYNNKN